MKDIIKELLATVGFIALFFTSLVIIGYAVSVVVDHTSENARDIKSEKECRKKGYAWHSVDGCFTQDSFRDQYIDS